MGIKIGTFVLSGGGRFNGQAYEMGKKLGVWALQQEITVFMYFGISETDGFRKKKLFSQVK